MREKLGILMLFGSLGLGGAAVADEPTGNNVLHCQLAGQGRRLILIFNESPIEKAGLAVMLGPTEQSSQYHPTYGATSLNWREGRLNVVFENTLAIDWDKEPLTDDCYAYRGGYYTFEGLTRTDDGTYEGTFRLPKKLVRHPQKTCKVPDEIFTPPTRISCRVAR